MQRMHWWNGQQWSDPAPPVHAAAPSRARPRRFGVLLTALVALATVVSVLIATNEHTKASASDKPVGNNKPASDSKPAAPASSLPGSDPTSSAPTSATNHSSNTRIARGTAAAELAVLPVKGRAPQTGYSRDQFGAAWTDDNDDPDGHNGCDTRNDILRRDLSDVVIKPGSLGCAVLTGTLHDPYTGKTISFQRGATSTDAVQIDHVVSLSDAWQTGAQQWSAAKRIDLANDPLNLLAVDGPTNEAKGDGDAATWLPPNKSYRCAYVARQVAVKARYGLWVTAAEHVAIARVLSGCPDEDVPLEAGAPPATPAARNTGGRSAKVFANCAALNQVYPHGVGIPGAQDHTASGTNPVTNFTVNAAVYDANSARDRDGDHIACEKH